MGLKPPDKVAVSVTEGVGEEERVTLADETNVVTVGEAGLTVRVSPGEPQAVVNPLLLASPEYVAFQK